LFALGDIAQDHLKTVPAFFVSDHIDIALKKGDPVGKTTSEFEIFYGRIGSYATAQKLQNVIRVFGVDEICESDCSGYIRLEAKQLVKMWICHQDMAMLVDQEDRIQHIFMQTPVFRFGLCKRFMLDIDSSS